MNHNYSSVFLSRVAGYVSLLGKEYSTCGSMQVFD
jgi:hypothetical protein